MVRKVLADKTHQERTKVLGKRDSWQKMKGRGARERGKEGKGGKKRRNKQRKKNRGHY